MMDPAQDLVERLRELRESFDQSFERPVPGHPERGHEFVIISAGASRYALELGTLLRLEKGRKVVPLPLGVAGLLGVAAFERHTVPVFSLASLLGFGEAKRAEPWLVLCNAAEPIALAFEGFFGSKRIAAADIFQVGSAERALNISRGAFKAEAAVVRIIDVASVLAIASHRLKQS